MSEGRQSRRTTERNERRATMVAWAIVAFLVAAMLARGFLSMWMVGDRPQNFRYRTAPLVPGETYSSSAPASTSTQAPKQVDLPPATVGKKAR